MLKDTILALNPHWEENFFYSYPLKRKVFTKILNSLSHPLMPTLIGPRRVGKTVLMKQTINHLISEGYLRKNILFFSFDEEVKEPLEIINAWEEMIAKKVRGSNFFVFFDEIQKLENWASKIKLLYDNLGIKIFLSGSASLEVRKGSESLAGRTVDIFVNPISFDEYLLLSGKKHSEIDEEEWKSYVMYMHKQLPELALYPSIDSKEYITSIVKKVIFEDVKKYYRIEESETIEGIFKFICRDPGQIIIISDLAKDFGISRITASNYLHALEKSFLLRKLYNFSKNARKIEVKAKKYYPFYTSLADYVELTDFSKLAEIEVAWKTQADFFWNDRGKEIDFIKLKDKDLTAIEVKTRNMIDKKDIKWLVENRIGAKRRIVITGFDSKYNLAKEDKEEIKDIEFLRLHKLESTFQSD
ncbi:MAG: ATP-binding protein [Candidatus Micrarchaeia archaeon]